MYLSVIIPAHNEEDNIKTTVESIYNYLDGRTLTHEIIVVVNGSSDKTAEITQSLVEIIPTLRIINLPIGGKGFAVKEGMKEASGDFQLFTDADNSTSIDHIEKMMPYFDQGFGVVIASIAAKGHKIEKGSEPFWRVLFGKMGNLFIRIMAVPGIYDTQRGFKIFTAKAASDIFPKITIAKWGFDVEALALARRFGYKIKEVAINWKNNPNSHVGLKAYVQVLFETMQVRWNLWTGKYK